MYNSNMSISPNQIQLSPEQQQRLAELADRTGKSWEEVLADALRDYRDRHQAGTSNGGDSFYDAAMRPGLLGCVSGGPQDLSTNPTHMEGFGEGGR